MSVKDFISILCLCSFQVCDSAKCELFDISEIKRYCAELEVEHGTVCYTICSDSHTHKYWWVATITCQDGFHLVNNVPRQCYFPSSKWIWNKSTVQSDCVPDEHSTNKSTIFTKTKPSPSSSTTTTIEMVFDDDNNDNRDQNLDKQDDSRPVAFVIVPIVIVLLIAFVIILVVIYRKRKVSRNNGPNCQNGTESRVANQANYHHVDIIDGNDSEYVYIADSDIKPKTIDDSEYNTLHENVTRNNCQNYDHIPVHSDTYAHTTSSCSNVQSDTDTYSHVYNGKHGNSRSGLNTEMGNIYNKLQVDDQNKLQAFDSTSGDPDYDHADILSGVPASIERDTYGHVTNGLDEDDCDYAMCHDYDDNFVSEK